MKRDILALSSIAFLVIIFFFRLFWPEPNLIVTPDFGRSDAWHFSFATKLVVSESLKRNELPLWEPRLGGGFPLFAEGQVGTLFLPNLLLFKFVDNPVVAYNMSYVVLFLILGWGTYAWLRVIGCTTLASLFGAITIVFSGQTIPRLPHHTLLESLSLTPLVLAIAHMVLTRRNPFWISIFALVLSQQLFTGSPQPVLLTLFMVGVYSASMIATRFHQLSSQLVPMRQSERTLGSSVKKIFVRLVVATLLGAGLAAIQLLPSAEMLAESTSPSGFSPEEASYYSFPLVHLKTLIAPFILGNPKFGTYPPFTTFDGSIFWENNLFIGILPIALLLLGFIRPGLAMQGLALRRFRLAIFFAIALLSSFLLMLGHNSPLYLLYSVWPLNLFRVPSRFAWIFVIALIGLASTKLSKLSPRVTILLIAVQTVWLMTTWWDYHAIQPANQWLTPTPFINSLQTSQGSVRTIGSELVHNQQFLKNGWNGNLDRYQFLTNVPAPNSNLYWDMRQTDVYAGRFLKRPSLVESLLGSEIKVSESVATISAQGKRLFDIYHAATIISPVPLDIESSLPVAAATTSAHLTITAYGNPDALARAYLAAQTIVAPTLAKAAEAIASPAFTPGKAAIVHDEAFALQSSDLPVPAQAGVVEITNETPMRVSMRADVTTASAILVFSDTYYPGWQATVDGKPIKIFPVNIKERGIHITKGSYDVIWQYRPKSVLFGAWISVLSIIVTGYPALLALFRKQT